MTAIYITYITLATIMHDDKKVIDSVISGWPITSKIRNIEIRWEQKYSHSGYASKDETALINRLLDANAKLANNTRPTNRVAENARFDNLFCLKIQGNKWSLEKKGKEYFAVPGILRDDVFTLYFDGKYSKTMLQRDGSHLTNVFQQINNTYLDHSLGSPIAWRLFGTNCKFAVRCDIPTGRIVGERDGLIYIEGGQEGRSPSKFILQKEVAGNVVQMSEYQAGLLCYNYSASQFNRHGEYLYPSKWIFVSYTEGVLTSRSENTLISIVVNSDNFDLTKPVFCLGDIVIDHTSQKLTASIVDRTGSLVPIDLRHLSDGASKEVILHTIDRPRLWRYGGIFLTVAGIVFIVYHFRKVLFRKRYI